MTGDQYQIVELHRRIWRIARIFENVPPLVLPCPLPLCTRFESVETAFKVGTNHSLSTAQVSQVLRSILRGTDPRRR